MRYGYRDVSFEVDARWTDETVIALVDETTGDPTMTFTVVREKKLLPLKAVVDDALRQLGTSLSGYRMMTREDRAVVGRSAVMVMGTALDPDVGPLVQHQAYVDIGADVVVFTATTPDTGAARGKAALDQALASLIVEPPAPGKGP